MRPEILKSTLAFSILKYTQRHPKTPKELQKLQSCTKISNISKDIQRHTKQPRET